MKKILAILSVLLLTNCGISKKNTATFNELFLKMQGHFFSQRQSNGSANYENMSLRLTPIWKEKGNYLFVEQGKYDDLENPNYVRVYKLSHSGDIYKKDVYKVKNQQKWIGKWNTPEVYNDLTETDIELEPGCQIILDQKEDGSFSGHTDFNCHVFNLEKTHYAAVVMKVKPNQIIFTIIVHDKDWNLIYGSMDTGYVFNKLK